MQSVIVRSFARTFLLPSLFLLSTAAALQAQQATISGRVLDEQGAPVPGAAVLVQGTETGAVVNNAGQYTLTVSPGTHQIEARGLGYRSVVETIDVAAGGTETVDFTLEASAIQLEEVVASVEAGEVTRRQMGTDIASIDVAQQLNN